MAKNPPRSKFLSVRLTPQEHKAFGVKAEAYGGPTYVARELIQAFTEGRVVLKPNPKKRSLFQ